MTPTETHDYRKGVALFLLFMICDCAVAVLTKLNTMHMSIFAYNFWRAAVALVCICGWLVSQKRLHTMWPAQKKDLFWNALLGFASTSLFVYFYKKLPTADVFAVINIAPFFVSLLSVLLLGDRIAKRHYVAIAVGFMGTLFIIRPGTAMFSLEGIGVLVCCFLYALSIVISGWISRRHEASVIVAWNMAIMALVTAPWALDVTPAFSWFDIKIMALTCFLFVTYRIAIVWSFRFAPSSYLSPLEYFSVIIVAAMAYWLYGEVPAHGLWLGAVIIAAAGLYILRTPQHVKYGIARGWLRADTPI